MAPPLQPGIAPANKGRRYPAEVLTTEECSRLLKACSRRAPTGIRDRAIISVLWRTGLRVGELVALLPKDLNLDVGAMRVLRGKGDKARTVGLDATASALIERWVEVRSKLPGVQRSSPLFCTLQGMQLATVCIRQMLKRRALKANIDRRVHPHALRHTHAAELAREGLPVNLIAAQLGHSNVATTSVYLNHVAAADVIAAMRQRPPALGAPRSSEAARQCVGSRESL